MNKMNWKWTLVCAAALVGATVPLGAQAWAGKPVPPTPPLVNPTPIKYQIQFWDVPVGTGTPQIYGTNNLGQTVGRYYVDGTSHAFLYDPAATDPTTAFDLHIAIGSDPVLEGWVIASATDINDDGVIVGYLIQGPLPFDQAFRRGYVLDTHASLDVSTWTLSLLPTDDWSYPQQINEHGDIAGVYNNPDQTYDVYFIPASGAPVSLLGQSVPNGRIYMNNPDPVAGRAAQIAGRLSDGRAFRWTTSSATPVIFNLDIPSVYGINDFGTICGSTRATFSSNKGKTSTGTYAMRYDGTQLDIWSNMPGYAHSITSAGDLVVSPQSGIPRYVYHDSWGFVRLDALIDPNDLYAIAWSSGGLIDINVITDCINPDLLGDDKTKIGLVSGVLVLANGNSVGYLLTPVKK